MKTLINGLLALNCKNNYVKTDNGKCYSKVCMMNQDQDIAMKIKAEGCLVYTHLEELSHANPT